MTKLCCCSDPWCQFNGCRNTLRHTYQTAQASPVARGCICPPTSEQTCMAPMCPRKPFGSAGNGAYDGHPRANDYD